MICCSLKINKSRFIVQSVMDSLTLLHIHFSKQQTELFKCLSSLMDSYSTWALYDPIVAPHDPRRVSKINTDWFPQQASKAQTSRAVWEQAPPGNFSFKSPFPGFWVIQIGYWSDFKLESIFIIKNIFIMKNLTNFLKMVEAGVPGSFMNLKNEMIALFITLDLGITATT